MEQHYDSLNSNLMDSFMGYFRSLFPQNDWFYALEWRSTCYKFHPHLPFEFDEWPIPILPNGDYYIFLEKMFKYGVIGHPWEQAMCIFGETILSELENNKPNLLSQKARINGNVA